MRSNLCDKIELASGLGVLLLFCKKCQVVEMEIGAISLKLSPDMIQRLANIMMKASLKLDDVIAMNKKSAFVQLQLIH